jgi:hypothetical protein
MRKLFAAIMVICFIVGVANAVAATSVTYVNGSGRTLYVYHLTTPNGATQDCKAMAYDGALQAGGSWSISVPGGQMGWVKFQLDTQSGGCGLGNNKFDSKVPGSSDSKSETVQIP